MRGTDDLLTAECQAHRAAVSRRSAVNRRPSRLGTIQEPRLGAAFGRTAARCGETSLLACLARDGRSPG